MKSLVPAGAVGRTAKRPAAHRLMLGDHAEAEIAGGGNVRVQVTDGAGFIGSTLVRHLPSLETIAQASSRSGWQPRRERAPIAGGTAWGSGS